MSILDDVHRVITSFHFAFMHVISVCDPRSLHHEFLFYLTLPFFMIEQKQYPWHEFTVITVLELSRVFVAALVYKTLSLMT